VLPGRRRHRSTLLGLGLDRSTLGLDRLLLWGPLLDRLTARLGLLGLVLDRLLLRGLPGVSLGLLGLLSTAGGASGTGPR
jgi:hypothetical protein